MPPAITLVRWVNENAFVSECRLDLVPPLADRFILGFPIDYGPVLLLMPFGFHLAVDTLPSGVQQAVAPGQSWLYPAFAFVPVWTSPYLPPSPASEAVNPTFGYGAPHLSARGTSTLLNSALLSAHFRVADQPGSGRVSHPSAFITNNRLCLLQFSRFKM